MDTKKKGITMKGYTFYLEYPSRTEKNKGRAKPGKLGNHQGNVIAKMEVNNWFNFSHEAIVALYDTPNSFVCSGSVGMDYLHTRCKRISEKLAREIHPNLFLYLDDDPYSF